MRSCLVCEAFPDHEGAHYSARDANNRIFSSRIRSLGKSKWTVLPHCSSWEGLPILASAQLPDNPEAICVAGIWFCEQTPALLLQELDGTESPSAAAGAEAAEELLPEEFAAATEQLSASDPAVPDPGPPFDPPSEEEESHMDTISGKGYLVWATGGLEVAVRAVNNNGSSSGPRVEDLKQALDGFQPPDSVLVSLTETLGRGDAWATVAEAPGEQASLLVCAGQLVERLVRSGLYEEVLLAHA